MTTTNLLEGHLGLQSQTLGAIQALLRYQKMNVDQLPGAVLLDGVVLVLSAKADQYYVCSSTKGCSCPSAVYHPEKRCKHQRKYFPSSSEPTRVADPRGHSSGKYEPVPEDTINPQPLDEILGAYDGPCTA